MSSVTDLFNTAYNDVFGSSVNTGVPSTAAAISNNNTGSDLSYSAGVSGGVPSTAVTGNSVVDSISSLSALAGSIVQTGLGAYTSFLNSKAITNAANRLGTTPTAVTGAINTVPLTPQQQSNQTMLYVGIAAIAGVILYKIAKRK